MTLNTHCMRKLPRRRVLRQQSSCSLRNIIPQKVLKWNSRCESMSRRYTQRMNLSALRLRRPLYYWFRFWCWRVHFDTWNEMKWNVWECTILRNAGYKRKLDLLFQTPETRFFYVLMFWVENVTKVGWDFVLFLTKMITMGKKRNVSFLKFIAVRTLYILGFKLIRVS